MRSTSRPVLARAAAAACVLAASAPLAAQTPEPDVRAEAVAGSEVERYLRVLQVAGVAPLYPWSARAFSPGEVEALLADTAHPWSARLPALPDSAPRPRLRIPRPRMELSFNSALPRTDNDGAVWAGRGLTASASAGFEYHAGILTVRLEPVVFWTQNRTFELVDNGRADSLRYLDPLLPLNIDVPQRFGDESFARWDPGQSTIRLDGRGFSFGVSTANEHWGPSADQPLILGPNAAGIPRAFFGTEHPWKVGIGRVHGRLMWGDLRQSNYSPLPQAHASRRFVSGIVAVFLPYGLDGLEVGYTRFWHEAWPVAGFKPRMLQRPVEAFFRSSLSHPDEGRLNQLAAAFARWVLPRGGLEVYGEFAREDHNFDLLDFVMEPDRSSSYLLGGRKVWQRGGTLFSLRAEWVDAQPSHLGRASHQGYIYRHTELRQGHTNRGQLLGSWAAYGGGGSVVALEGFTPAGRWSADWTRTRVRAPLEADEPMIHVVHSLGGEAVLFRGRWDLVGRLRAGMELNRGFTDDVFNLSAGLGVRVGL